MAMNVRRVVTGHDSTGKSVILTDEMLPLASRGQGNKIDGFDLWSTQRVPVDNSDAAEPGQRKGFIKRDVEPHNNYVRSGAGTVVRIIEWSPGHSKFTHRTETLDYIVILSGEIDLELDGDEVAHLKAGDVVIQRGGNRAGGHEVARGPAGSVDGEATTAGLAAA